MSGLEALPEDIRAMAARMAMPDFQEWQKQVRSTGACSNPTRMRGYRTVTDAETGEVLDHYSTDDEPTGYRLVRCGNRRAAVCPSCSQLHRDDTYQVASAGLTGGKGIPETVAEHPAIFATLTAPSFGAVHTRHKTMGRDGKPLRCRVRRNAEKCPHGVVMSCRERHGEDDPRAGGALCPDCYDYAGAVLFNAYAGELWKRLTIYLRREVAATVGLSRSALGKVAKVSFFKVAEYQARGVIHFHSVIRIDGPDGPETSPPVWATVDLLDDCLRRAVATTSMIVPDPADPDWAFRELRFGTQVDTQTIAEAGGGITSRNVARYIAKYVTKGGEITGLPPRRIKNLDALQHLHLPAHTECMVRTCFALDGVSAYGEVPFGRWAHMLGYRGHAATKSRRYSVTYGELRDERKAHQEAERRQAEGLPARDEREILVDAKWKFSRSGLARGEEMIVDGIRAGQVTARRIGAA
ncbi:replication initiator [Actinoplanes aureus]|uniref:Replication initiation protein n=1 Tax=Actinoplanes aureus TaxID=2792083 RepID=A0A931C875_9ACTN|nr:replication initiator [Actinoplanes aureus]MBG0563177.1 replication initiation protein [Actinoplanes aureus]